MSDQESQLSSAILSRRNFVKASAIYGALVTSKTHSALARSTSPSDRINVALIGCGEQGGVHIKSTIGMNKVEGVNFVAVCDIWEVNRESQARRIAKLKDNDNARAELAKIGRYEDYRQMLEQQKDIDAVLIASPDFMHHVHTRAALEAGYPVYCEKMMSNTLEGARDMVRAQRETDGILQIGHQRRSNPRYRNLRDKLVFGAEAFGRITHAYGQWNRSVSSGHVALPKKNKFWLSQELLEKYGFGDPNLDWREQMYRFRNWRFFRKFGGGVISDLGAHQIDVFNWFFDNTPKAVIASGGVDYHMKSELYDNVMSIYEYDTPKGVARGYYQVLTTTSALRFFERFMGDEGTAVISEDSQINQVYSETDIDWNHLQEQGLISRDVEVKYNAWALPKTWGSPPKPWLRSPRGGLADARASKALAAWELSTVLNELPHTPHLRNFFDVVRSGNKEDLNCPVEEAFKTCVTVLKIYQAVEAGRKIEFSPEDFVA